MSEYKKHTWQEDEVIDSDKLNNIENGIAEAHAKTETATMAAEKAEKSAQEAAETAKETAENVSKENLKLSGGTMTGIIDMLKGDSNTGIMNGENKKIFGYGVDGKFYTGDPEYPLTFRGSAENPTYNTFDMLKVQTGTYKGTGKSGSSGKNKITFTFTPKIVIVYEKAQAFLVSPCHYMIALDGMESGFTMTASDAINLTDGYVNGFGMEYTWTTTSLTWWHPHDTSNGYAEEQLNKSGKTYYWIAIG